MYYRIMIWFIPIIFASCGYLELVSFLAVVIFSSRIWGKIRICIHFWVRKGFSSASFALLHRSRSKEIYSLMALVKCIVFDLSMLHDHSGKLKGKQALALFKQKSSYRLFCCLSLFPGNSCSSTCKVTASLLFAFLSFLFRLV